MSMRHKQTRLLNLYQEKLSEYQKKHDIDASVEAMLLAITEADPDQAKFKNSKWLINNLLNDKFLWEDIASGRTSKAFDTLSRFLNIRKQWPENNFRDINQYQGLSGIAEKIRPFEIQKTSGDLKREERARVYDETIVLYDNNDYLVVIPKTEFASCYWGRNTEWCTAATESENYFDSYNQSGPLIIAITPDNQKYQFHCTCSPMDENDKEITDIEDLVLVELAKATGKVLNLKYKDWNDPEFCELALEQNTSSIEDISSSVKDYYKYCLISLEYNASHIELIDPNYERYMDLCRYAVKQDGNIIDTISSKSSEEYFELCKLAIQSDPTSIMFISRDVTGYSELCKLAVQLNGSVLEYINEATEGFNEICTLAVRNDPSAIQYIRWNHPDIEELSNYAVSKNGMLIKYISHDTKGYKKICETAIRQNPDAICLISYFSSHYERLLELSNTLKANNPTIKTAETDKEESVAYIQPESWLHKGDYKGIIEKLDKISFSKDEEISLTK